MSITIDLPDDIEVALREVALRNEAETLKRPAELFVMELLKQRYAVATSRDKSQASFSYSDADAAAVTEGLTAIEAGRVRPVKDAFAAFAARHNRVGAPLE